MIRQAIRTPCISILEDEIQWNFLRAKDKRDTMQCDEKLMLEHFVYKKDFIHVQT